MVSFIGREVDADMGIIAEKHNFMKSLSLLLEQKPVQEGLGNQNLEQALLSLNIMEHY